MTYEIHIYRKILCMGIAICTLTACGNSENAQSVQNTPSSSTGVYVPNQTGKPMSEDIKDELESKHKQEAAAIKTIQKNRRGATKVSASSSLISPGAAGLVKWPI